MGPLCLAFDFLTIAETRQLIIRQRKDHNKWCPLSQPSSATIIKARDYNPMKRWLHVWVRAGWGIDQSTAEGGTTVTYLWLFNKHRDTASDPKPMERVGYNTWCLLSRLSSVIQVTRQDIMIQRNGDCICRLEHCGGLINEQQGMWPLWVAFDF